MEKYYIIIFLFIFLLIFYYYKNKEYFCDIKEKRKNEII
jgi:cytochrome c1